MLQVLKSLHLSVLTLRSWSKQNRHLFWWWPRACGKALQFDASIHLHPVMIYGWHITFRYYLILRNENNFINDHGRSPGPNTEISIICNPRSPWRLFFNNRRDSFKNDRWNDREGLKNISVIFNNISTTTNPHGLVYFFKIIKYVVEAYG